MPVPSGPTVQIQQAEEQQASDAAEAAEILIEFTSKTSLYSPFLVVRNFKGFADAVASSLASKVSPYSADKVLSIVKNAGTNLSLQKLYYKVEACRHLN